MGALLGLACGGAFAFALHRESMRVGFAAIIITFALISAGLLAMRVFAHGRMLGFGAAAVLVFLVTVVAASFAKKT